MNSVLDTLRELTDARRTAVLDLMSPGQRAWVHAEWQREQAVAEFPSPLALATRLDPQLIVTPMLQVIDDHLVRVRDALLVKQRRAVRLRELLATGMGQGEAIEQAAADVPDDGIMRLIVSAPPQDGKSTQTTRYNILWLLRQFPYLKVGIVSYDGTKADEFGQAIRSDIELFNGDYENLDLGLRLKKDQRAMGRWSLVTGGGLYCIGTGGGFTGRPADYIVIDDPIKDYRDADSLIKSEQAATWWETVARPRLAPWAPVVEVATRWNENDLAGQLITREAELVAQGLPCDHWTVLNIPAQADHDPSRGETDILGRQPGEYMQSCRGRTVALWEATKAGMTERFWNALYQGRPSPTSGAVLLREWWRRYDDVVWMANGDHYTFPSGWLVDQSWDMTFKDTRGTDYVVGAVFAKRGAESRMVYMVRARMSFTTTCDAVQRLKLLFPQTRSVYVEGKANGNAVIDALGQIVPGLVEVSPNWGSKTARAEAVSPFVRAGNLWLPINRIAHDDPAIAWSPDDVIDEATAFPNGAHDDIVDAITQYLAETFLRGSDASLSVPTGRIVTRQAATPVDRLSPMQRRLTERALGRGPG